MRERTALILGGGQEEPFLSLIKLTEVCYCITLPLTDLNLRC